MRKEKEKEGEEEEEEEEKEEEEKEEEGEGEGGRRRRRRKEKEEYEEKNQCNIHFMTDPLTPLPSPSLPSLHPPLQQTSSKSTFSFSGFVSSNLMMS